MFSNLKPSRVFFGWWIVGASFLVALYIGGALFYGFTAVFEPIAEEMDWNYTQVSFAASLRGLEIGLLAPVIGILVDRWGPRRLIFSGAIVTAAGLVLLSRTMSLGMFYGAFVLISIGMSGCTMTVLMTAVANWFHRSVGMASGIAISGFGAGGLLVPVVVRLIEMYEWRMTMIILALGMLVMVLPLSFLFRHKPEQYGYLPDGRVKDQVQFDDSPSLPQAVEVDVKAKQAIKSGSFWHMAVAFAYNMAVITAVSTHVMPYLSSIGVARVRSGFVASAIPLMSIGGRLGFGWFADKLDGRLVAAGAFAMMGFGLFCFGYIPSTGTWLLVPFLVLFGIGYGGANVLRPSMVREYFGRTNFGTILGLIIGTGMLGSIAGPPLAGWVYDNWGTYHGIWLALAGFSVVPIISVLTIPPASTAGDLPDKA